MIRLHRTQRQGADSASHFNPTLSEDDRVIYVNPAYIVSIEQTGFSRKSTALVLHGENHSLDVTETPEAVLEEIQLSEVTR